MDTKHAISIGKLKNGEVSIMPWTPSSAKRFSKRASRPALALKWARIANAVRVRTGNDARAIRIANAEIKKDRKK